MIFEEPLKRSIRDNELNWLKSYLTNRKQTTRVNNVKSSEITNGYRVPQGTILGALLFIIYIKDMPKVLQKCEMVSYADDTLIFNISETDEECQINLKFDLNDVSKWLKIN